MASWWFTFGFCCWWEKSLSYDWFTVKGSGHPILVQDFFCQQLQLKLCSHDISSSSVTHCYHVPEFYSHYDCSKQPSMGEGDVTWNHCRSSIIERQTWMHQSMSKKSGFPSKIPRKKHQNETYLKTKLLFQDFLHIVDPWGDVIRIKIFMANRSFSSQTPEYPLQPMSFTQLLQELINRKIMAKLKQNSLGQNCKIAAFFFSIILCGKKCEARNVPFDDLIITFFIIGFVGPVLISCRLNIHLAEGSLFFVILDAHDFPKKDVN